MTYRQPLRTPDPSDRMVMNRRAWWLLIANFLIPGTPQLLAGSRRLGRLGVGVWLTCLALLIAGVVCLLAAPSLLTALLTNTWVLVGLEVAIVLVLVLWVLLTVNTFVLLRIGRLRVPSRALLSMVTVLGLVVGVGIGTYGATSIDATRGLLSKLFTASEVVKPVDGRFNFLLIGGDSGAGRTGLRPDSMSVVSVDATTGKSVVIGIPRNLEQVPLGGSPLTAIYPQGYNCGDNCLIDYLYTVANQHSDLYTGSRYQGKDIGAMTVMDAASAVTGLQVQYYVMVDMAGFASIVDALGGVTIDVPKKVVFVDGNDGALKYHGYVNAGVQHMDGQTALWYARSRKLSTDYDRMERQRQLQTALLQQFSPTVLLSRFQQVAQASPEFVHTSIPQNALSQFVDLAGKAKTLPVTSVDLVPPTVDPAAPDYTAIHQLVASTIANSAVSPSASAK